MLARQSKRHSRTTTPAKTAPLRALGLAFLGMGECNFEADEVIIDPRVTKLRLL